MEKPTTEETVSVRLGNEADFALGIIEGYHRAFAELFSLLALSIFAAIIIRRLLAPEE